MTKGFIDLFSGHANDYKKFRPRYPQELFTYLSSLCPNLTLAWDCGTGNGQAAQDLANYCPQVYATDASAEQIKQAEPKNNIEYRVATAEDSGLASASVDLITVFQALHWFDIDKFFAEAQRVLKPQGVLAIVGYHTVLTGNQLIDQTYHDFCFNYLWEKNCWAISHSAPFF